MKKFIYLIPLLFIFLIPNVKANNINGYLNNLQTPSIMYFFKLNSTNTSTEIGKTSSQIYSNGDNYNYSYFGYTPRGGFSFDSHGLGISLNSVTTIKSGSTYSLTMYFATNDNTYITGPDYTDFISKVGVSRSAIMNNTNTSVKNVSYNTNANFDLGGQYNNYVYGYRYLQSFNIVFTANTSGNYISTAFSTSKNISVNEETFLFLGYYLNYIGQETASASDISESVDLILTDEFLSVEEKLDAVDEQLGNVDTSIQEQTNQQQQNHEETMNTIKDSNSDGATSDAGNFFNNFEDNDFGLSGIITAPLSTINTITSNSCSPISLTIPFVNKNMTLPCMTDIYEEHFGSFLDIYQIITFGIVSYWVCVQIYAMVKGFKNPDSDEIEVMDL